jgi:hypothetical protein
VESTRRRAPSRLLAIESHERAQDATQPILIETANQAPTMGDGDLPGFLGYHDRQRIRVLGDADGGRCRVPSWLEAEMLSVRGNTALAATILSPRVRTAPS